MLYIWPSLLGKYGADRKREEVVLMLRRCLGSPVHTPSVKLDPVIVTLMNTIF